VMLVRSCFDANAGGGAVAVRVVALGGREEARCCFGCAVDIEGCNDRRCV
jgi:hypothetical protein